MIFCNLFPVLIGLGSLLIGTLIGWVLRYGQIRSVKGVSDRHENNFLKMKNKVAELEQQMERKETQLIKAREEITFWRQHRAKEQTSTKPAKLKKRSGVKNKLPKPKPFPDEIEIIDIHDKTA